MVDSLPDTADRDRLIGLIDSARHEYEYARQRRIEVVNHAHESGMSYHHIAVALGMTEGGVRALVRRAAAA